jgi:acetyl esterase/lipase
MICRNIKLFENGYSDAYITTYVREDAAHNRGRPFPAVLIAPGGAYLATSDREAEEVALAFTALGYQAFVLRYSCLAGALMPRPVVEGFRAIGLIREHSGEWNIDRDRIVVCGFSAGGHLCSCLAAMHGRRELAELAGYPETEITPNAAILAYPCIHLPSPNQEVNTGLAEALLPAMLVKLGQPEMKDEVYIKDGTIHYDLYRSMQRYLSGVDDGKYEMLRDYSSDRAVDEHTVPSFVWGTAEDTLVPAENVLTYVHAMIAHKREVEFHLFARGPHGLSLATPLTGDPGAMVDPQAAGWLDLAAGWLDRLFEGTKK